MKYRILSLELGAVAKYGEREDRLATCRHTKSLIFLTYNKIHHNNCIPLYAIPQKLEAAQI